MRTLWPIIAVLICLASVVGRPAAIGAEEELRLPGIIGRWSAAVPLVPDARQYFVAPDGKPTNAGTKDSPWDFTSVIEGKQKVAPGDIVWLRGGTYGKGGDTLFRCGLKGTQERPIFLRQYPGERATVDGGIEVPPASTWVWFWGFEITNSSPERRCLTSQRPPGLNLQGRGHKAVNLAIHDAGHPGIGFWVRVGDSGEVHGCILWGNGLYDMGDKRFPNGWTRGSPIYAQNQEGTRYITDVIAFRNFTTGMKAYTEGGYADGFHFEGNITFDSPDWNLFGSGGKQNPMQRLKVIGNCTYRRPDDPVKESVQFGYHNTANVDAVVRDNYFALGRGGDRAFFLKHWCDITVTGNTLIGTDTIAHWLPSPLGAKAVWDNNSYFHRGGKPFLLDKENLDFATWKAKTGFDAHSTFTPDYPTGQKVFVRPNKYEPGRGNVAVYNWAHLPTVSVDLSRILKPGDHYEVRDAQNFFGRPVATGTYDGKPVVLPMNLKEVAPLVGNVTHIKYQGHTAPEFAAFVVLTVDK